MEENKHEAIISKIRLLFGRWSFVGLFVGALFFAISLSPSLVPRPFMLQGALSGITLALGYGLGVLGVWLWRYLELPEVKSRACTYSKIVLAFSAGVTLSYFYSQATLWQNSIRSLMEMPPVEDSALIAVTGIALAIALLLIFFVRALSKLYVYITKKVHRFVPRRISYLVGGVALTFLLITIVNGVLVSRVIDVVDLSFASIDAITPDGLSAPVEATRSGSSASLIAFGDLGKAGKEFVTDGPRSADLRAFSGRAAVEPIRVYVGLTAADSIEKQAELALEELKRTDAFSRSILVIATPTGTGWLDAGAIDTLEYLHNGDTAVVGVQYSYLQSPVALVLDPERVKRSARIVFETIYNHWRSLPENERPDLYLHGLSLGSYGSESSVQAYTLLGDPIQGALWAGPPFANEAWPQIQAARAEGSPAWLPQFDDGSLIRFMGQEAYNPDQFSDWGPLRVVYLLYPSDAIVFFEWDLWLRKPDWLEGERGGDVSPYLDWYPFVTFWQVGFDMLVTTNVPLGYGHRYDPHHYLEAWIDLTQPDDWSDTDTLRLEELLYNERVYMREPLS